MEEATKAFSEHPWKHLNSKKSNKPVEQTATTSIIRQSIAVDAACSGNPGLMEYRGVFVSDGVEIFHMGPLEEGTNNIGEFLAIVHALALLQKSGKAYPLYTDSVNAMKWIERKKCNTQLAETARNRPIFELIARAEKWLRENSFTTPILKWDTKKWGEIPADFGRK